MSLFETKPVNLDIDEMMEELYKAGWREVKELTWKAPCGLLYRGTITAYNLMKTHPELNVQKRTLL